MPSHKVVYLIGAMAAFLAAGACYLMQPPDDNVVPIDKFCYLSQRRLTPCPEGR